MPGAGDSGPLPSEPLFSNSSPTVAPTEIGQEPRQGAGHRNPQVGCARGVHFLPVWGRMSATGHCWATLGCLPPTSLSEAAQCCCVRGCLGLVGLEKCVTVLNPSQASPTAAQGSQPRPLGSNETQGPRRSRAGPNGLTMPCAEAGR